MYKIYSFPCRSFLLCSKNGSGRAMKSTHKRIGQNKTVLDGKLNTKQSVNHAQECQNSNKLVLACKSGTVEELSQTHLLLNKKWGWIFDIYQSLRKLKCWMPITILSEKGIFSCSSQITFTIDNQEQYIFLNQRIMNYAWIAKFHISVELEHF